MGYNNSPLGRLEEKNLGEKSFYSRNIFSNEENEKAQVKKFQKSYNIIAI